jgi:DNA-binding beta-propeller fold protein YncE
MLFHYPRAVASDSTHIWVANDGGPSVTELSAKTGGLVQVISDPSYKFYQPGAIASDGTHVWVANYSNSVTELSAKTGDLVQVLSGPSYKFAAPIAIASDGTHVWVANDSPAGVGFGHGGNSVTELSAKTGDLVQVISGPSYGFNQPDAVASDGTHVWVANFYANTLTELSAKTASLVQVISG